MSADMILGRCIILQYYHWKSVAPGVQWNKTNTTIETELKDAAWYYPQTFEKANHIKNYVAFCMSLIPWQTLFANASRR